MKFYANNTANIVMLLDVYRRPLEIEPMYRGLLLIFCDIFASVYLAVYFYS